MLAKLTGICTLIQDNRVVMDVNGLGFGVCCLCRELSHIITQDGHETSLWVEAVVSNDSIVLYGFADMGALTWFNMLRKVTGVGSKLSMQILDTYSQGNLATAIKTQDVDYLCVAKGVGKKVATRLIHELQDRIPSLDHGTQSTDSSKMDQDIVQALVALGYSRANATRAVHHVLQNSRHNPSVQDMVKRALVHLQSKPAG